MVHFFLLLRRLSGARWAGKGPWRWWGQLLGRLGPPQASTSLSTQDSWPPGGTLRATPARPPPRSNCPRYFPSHEPHETVLGGEGERTHFRSGCESSGLAEEALSTRRGPLCGLGSPGDVVWRSSLRSNHQENGSTGCVVGRNCRPTPPTPARGPFSLLCEEGVGLCMYS